jgi:hypothetical protein
MEASGRGSRTERVMPERSSSYREEETRQETAAPVAI